MSTTDTLETSPLTFHAGQTDEKPNLEHLRVKRRNGDVVGYDESKIKNAMLKAFKSVEGDSVSLSNRVIEKVNNIASTITQQFFLMHPTGGIINIEDIQRFVKFGLIALPSLAMSKFLSLGFSFSSSIPRSMYAANTFG